MTKHDFVDCKKIDTDPVLAELRSIYEGASIEDRAGPWGDAIRQQAFEHLNRTFDTPRLQKMIEEALHALVIIGVLVEDTALPDRAAINIRKDLN